MDEHGIGRESDQAFQAEAGGLLSTAAAGHRLQQFHARERRIAVLAIVRADNHAHRVDFGMVHETAYGVAQQGAAAERQVLLGNFRAEAGAATAGEDQSDAARHIESVRFARKP